MTAGDAVVVGSNAFTEQPNTRRWVNGSGWVTIRTWVGPLNESLIAAQEASAQTAGAERIDTTRGQPTTILATVPDAFDPTNTNPDGSNAAEEWELNWSDLDKALASHGKFNSSSQSPLGISRIDADIRAGTAYDKDYETLYAEGAASNFNAYAKLRGMGVDSYTAFAPVLRKVLTFDRTSAYLKDYQSASANQGRVVSWGTLFVPQNAGIERPWVRLFVAAAMMDAVPASAYRPGFSGVGAWAELWINEWLVKPPSVRYSRQGRTRRRQLVQEYIGAVQWSKTLYDGGTHTP